MVVGVLQLCFPLHSLHWTYMKYPLFQPTLFCHLSMKIPFLQTSSFQRTSVLYYAYTCLHVTIITAICILLILYPNNSFSFPFCLFFASAFPALLAAASSALD